MGKRIASKLVLFCLVLAMAACILPQQAKAVTFVYPKGSDYIFTSSLPTKTDWQTSRYAIGFPSVRVNTNSSFICGTSLTMTNCPADGWYDPEKQTLTMYNEADSGLRFQPHDTEANCYYIMLANGFYLKREGIAGNRSLTTSGLDHATLWFAEKTESGTTYIFKEKGASAYLCIAAGGVLDCCTSVMDARYFTVFKKVPNFNANVTVHYAGKSEYIGTIGGIYLPCWVPEKTPITLEITPERKVTTVIDNQGGTASGEISYTLRTEDNLTETHKISIAILPHNFDFSSYKIITEPTCTTDGLEAYVCTNKGCSEYLSARTIRAKGHQWGEWIANKDGTKHYRFCYGVSKEQQWEDHQYTTSITPPTHSAQGFTTHTCSACRYFYVDTYTNATGHNFGNWIHNASTENASSTHSGTCLDNDGATTTVACSFKTSVTPPTHTEQGFTTHTCEACGYSYKDTYTNATGHNFGNWIHNASTENAASTHSGSCLANDGATTTVTCSFKTSVTAPTHTEQGFTTHTCEACGYSYKDTYTNATGHNFGNWIHDALTENTASTHSRTCQDNDGGIETVACSFEKSVITPPTHTEKGFTTHTCSVCNYSYTSDITQTIPHDFGNQKWVVNDEETHKKTCECGEILTANHIFGAGKVTKKPTQAEEGIRTYTCNQCGYQKTEPIEKLPEGHVPQTGDNTPLLLYIILFIGSSLVLIGQAIRHKRLKLK